MEEGEASMGLFDFSRGGGGGDGEGFVVTFWKGWHCRVRMYYLMVKAS